MPNLHRPKALTRSLQIHVVKIQRIQHEHTHIHSHMHRVKHSGKEDSEFKHCFCFPWQDSRSADVCDGLVDRSWLGLHQACPDRQGEKTVHGRHSSAGRLSVRLSVHGCHSSPGQCCLSVHGRQTRVCLDKTFVAAKMILVAASASVSATCLTSDLQTDERVNVVVGREGSAVTVFVLCD